MKRKNVHILDANLKKAFIRAKHEIAVRDRALEISTVPDEKRKQQCYFGDCYLCKDKWFKTWNFCCRTKKEVNSCADVLVHQARIEIENEL